MERSKKRRVSIHIAIVLLCVIFNFSEDVQSQNAQKSASLYDSFSSYAISYPQQAGYAVKMPVRFTSEDWTIAAVSGITFGFILLNDEALLTKIQSNSSAQEARKLNWTEVFGNGLVAAPALAILYWYGTKQSDPLAKEAALAGLQAFILSAGASVVLKHVSHRPRPDESGEPYKWKGPFEGFHNDAFPSGHTMRAFAMATVLSGYYKEHPGLRLALFGAAGLTAIGRLKSGEHWPSDVFAGAILGYALGRSILHFNKTHSSNVLLRTDGNSLGMIIRLK